jgi:hypothetical protein
MCPKTLIKRHEPVSARHCRWAKPRRNDDLNPTTTMMRLLFPPPILRNQTLEVLFGLVWLRDFRLLGTRPQRHRAVSV